MVVLLLLALLQVGLVTRDVVLVAHARPGGRPCRGRRPRPGGGSEEAAEAAAGLSADRLEVRTSGGGDAGSPVRVG